MTVTGDLAIALGSGTLTQNAAIASAGTVTLDMAADTILEITAPTTNVIATTAAQIDISIKLAILMTPGDPRLKDSGFKKAEIATNTADSPTRLWKPATNSGIAVIGIL